ncbi:hypothetical protein ACFLZZ_03610 [Nanoarchaeota archaeon]
MVLETAQIGLLVFIALLGIPTGFFLAHLTKEELKDGRKWFKLLSIISFAAFLASLFLVNGNVQPLMLTVSAFIFFISTVPLFVQGR